jgi:hypothetical protein
MLLLCQHSGLHKLTRTLVFVRLLKKLWGYEALWTKRSRR